MGENLIRKARTATVKTLTGRPDQPQVTVVSRTSYWYGACPDCGAQCRPGPSWVHTTRKRAKDALYVHRKLICLAGPGGDSR